MRITFNTPDKEATCILFFFKNRELYIQLHAVNPKKMIKSAIFEPNLLNMSPKSMLLLVSLFLLGLTSTAQYTEKINTNRPGVSQGAFSVGNNVLQLEGGLGFGRERHKIFDTKSSTFNFDYEIRYGLLIEQLEINLNGSFRSDGVRQTIGANEQKIRKTDFESNTIGVKYLIYDPYKKPKENDSINYDELKSWKERYRFKWKSLIPAVSAYVGMNYVNTDNAFTFPTDATISPKIVVMTQNNWWTSNAGSWVLVTNLIVDKITTDNPAYGWIITSTHTLNDKWAVFGEYQGQKSDFYSDNIIRLGGAYLWNKDLQIDANIATNFKDTPSIFRVSVGASYRFDWHSKDEIIEKPGFESGIKKDESEEDEEKDKEKDKDGLELDEEFEEIENDSLKLEKTPFINEFEDGSHRDAMEKDLDERRTEQRLERERIEKEKQDKKDEKKFKKEERRRLKREAKAAKQAEKARIKAEKEKQKMIEDIDAELDKMEQDDGLDDELKQIDDELKKLEEMEKELGTGDKQDAKEKEAEESKKAEEEEDVDAAYEKLQKEQEKAKKEEEKRKKAEEKRKKKEEKKRKKEEEKRKKAEEKQRKKEEKEKEKNENDN
ncbi:hypothetical protein GBO31_06335 [Aquimarina litoralis]|nr:hypothetical protein [Aquimarina litoralis]